MLSKFLETFDAEVLHLGSVVSGHTLKHVAAALSGGTVCYMLMQRTLKEPATSRESSANAFGAATELVANGLSHTH